MILGYMRPTQEDSDCQQQAELLKSCSCDRIFQEAHASAKQRKELDALLAMLNPGDTLAVARLFTLADSSIHLAELLDVIEAKSAFLLSLHEQIHTEQQEAYHFQDTVRHLVQFQRDMISEKTKQGLFEAKLQGTPAGRPRKPDENVKRAITMYESGQYSLGQIKEATGISKSTLYRYLEN